MAEKKIPLSREQLETLTEQFPTPFHLYDERGIRENAQRLQAAFAWNPGFKEYFAVKAAPNPLANERLNPPLPLDLGNPSGGC